MDQYNTTSYREGSNSQAVLTTVTDYTRNGLADVTKITLMTFPTSKMKH